MQCFDASTVSEQKPGRTGKGGRQTEGRVKRGKTLSNSARKRTPEGKERKEESGMREKSWGRTER